MMFLFGMECRKTVRSILYWVQHAGIDLSEDHFKCKGDLYPLRRVGLYVNAPCPHFANKISVCADALL